VKLQYNVGGVTCASNGPQTTAPSSTPAAAYKTQFVICSPDPSVQLAACKTGEIALPQASAAAACVVVPNDFTCAGTAYGAFRFLSKSGTFTDNRTCGCSCVASQASCTGGSATIFDGVSCTQNAKALTLGQCTALDSEDTVLGTAPSPAAAGCTARALPTGDATAAIDTKLCCLGTPGGN
jgi:hypothetical protein